MSKKCLGCMEEYSQEFSVCPHCGYIEGTTVDEAVHMEPGTSLADRYIIGKVLGYGGFGVTYIAWDKLLEQKVAIKEYLPSEFSTRMPGDPTVTVFSGDRSEQFTEGLDKFVEEAKRLSKFQNEAGIVKVFDSFKSNNTAYIVMEYLDGETLTSYMEREGVIPEDEAVEMLAPLMNSLQTVHEAGILHRDIAPDNIFLTKNGEVKLIDFGASRYATTSHSRSLTVIIKPGYSPEEQYRSRGDQGPHTDVYALAAVMYKMITGITPPDALERRALIETKKKELLKDIHKTNKTIEPNVENAILNAMNVQIEDRTPDMVSFMGELNSTVPVKRRYGKIKKIDVYAWPLWVKIVVPAVIVACLVTGALLTTGIIDFPSLFSDEVVVPEGMVVVPDVEGMDREIALEELTKCGLLPSPEGNVVSAYVDADKIILQTPQGGSYLELNSKVVLTVSSGAGITGPVNGIATVPYVTWDTEELAISKLKQAGLGEPIIEKDYDDNVESGKVISQSLSVGTEVEQGTSITIKVSLGSRPFDMPSVKGQTKSEAEKALQAKGLVVRFNYATDDSVAENTVIGQDVSEGTTVKRGDSVTLTISTKSATISVANVVGKTKDDATSTLKGQGFKVNVLENYDDTVAKDKVISQTPAGGTGQINGATITVVISKGPTMVTVPNVVGKTEQEAKTAIINAKLDISIEYQKETTVPAGQVISQTPAGNSQQAKGTTIVIWVSTADPLINVPNVKGETKEIAISKLQSAGFTVTTSTEYSNTIAKDKVISQTPEAGTSQKKGTTINICVSAGEEKVTVPNVVGETETNATSRLKSAGFTVTTSTEYSDTVAKGNIIRQTPAGGVQASKASQIAIVVSLGKEGVTDEKYFTFSNGEITGFDETYEGDVVIPTTINGQDVMGIGEAAFHSCYGIESVEIPGCVYSIGRDAFSTCHNLTSVTIGDGVTEIAEKTFYDCVRLTTVTIGDSVNYIGDSAFAQCTSLTNIIIPDSVTNIGDDAFRWCSSLNSVTFGDNVRSIGDYAFHGCLELTKVKLGDSVISIGSYAFLSDRLTSVELGDSVETIGDGAFKNCLSLRSVNIPKSVTHIGKEAFSNCDLRSVTISDKVSSIGENAFYHCIDLKVYFESEAQKEKFKGCFESGVQLIVR